jgi:hypothetical protein
VFLFVPVYVCVLCARMDTLYEMIMCALVHTLSICHWSSIEANNELIIKVEMNVYFVEKSLFVVDRICINGRHSSQVRQRGRGGRCRMHWSILWTMTAMWRVETVDGAGTCCELQSSRDAIGPLMRVLATMK